MCEAYKVLSNADLRRQYDMMRSGRGGGYAGRSWGRTAGSSGGRTAGGAASGDDWSKWYDEYASGGSKRRTNFNEETADQIDDSFGKILSDFLQTVVVKGGRGVVEDVVEFLEDQVIQGLSVSGQRA